MKLIAQLLAWLLKPIILNQEIIMGDLSKLNTSVQTLSGNVDQLLGQQAPSDQAGIDAATAAVDAVNSKVVAALNPSPNPVP